MSLRALFEGVLPRITRTVWGTKITDAARVPRDPGVNAAMAEMAPILASAEPIQLSEPIQVTRNFEGPVFEVFDGEGIPPAGQFADIYDSPDAGAGTPTAQQYPPGTVNRTANPSNADIEIEGGWNRHQGDLPDSDLSPANPEAAPATEQNPPVPTRSPSRQVTPSGNYAAPSAQLDRSESGSNGDGDGGTGTIGQLFKAVTSESGGEVTIVAIDSAGNSVGSNITVKVLPE